MTPELKAKWVAALREPTRTQGRARLQVMHGGQCCLGVLCEIAGIPTVEPIASEVRGHHVKLVAYRLPEDPSLSGYTDFPSEAMLHQFGLPEFRANDLARLNDSGHTFAEIADHIEQVL